jgi:hypothetical protein
MTDRERPQVPPTRGTWRARAGVGFLSPRCSLTGRSPRPTFAELCTVPLNLISVCGRLAAVQNLESADSRTVVVVLRG